MKKTLIIMIDAVRPDYISKEYTPFLYELKEKNTFLKLHTLLGYSSGIHPSIYTGCYQDKTGKFVVFYKDEENSIFKWTKFLKLIPTDFLRKYAIAFMKVPYYYTPKKYKKFLPKFFRETVIKVPPSIPLDILPYFNMGNKGNKLKTLYDYLDENSVSYESYATTKNTYFENVTSLEELKISDKTVDSFYIYEPDGYGHKYGANSKEIKELMSKIDKKVKSLYKEALEKFKDVNLFIFSDHGMYNVEKFVDIQTPLKKAGLEQPRDFIAFFDTTFARFWTKDNGVKDKIIEVLNNTEGVRYLNDTLLDKYKINFKEKEKFGEIIGVVEGGIRQFPDYFSPVRSTIKGLHGTFPEYEGSYGIFFSNCINTSEKEIKVVDILPTIMKISNLKYDEKFVDGDSIV
ncbi:alkaline phosphatase family protein [Haliovirga abyssi]|uniref:Alkaline phosphatase family protein n=1 Tax=Haliovirga abyssi TaxID=2996794 RepID=A0AAU9DRD9_9FUSO|nr:alkaline phosphatase family protein [Haliovirga abyssi]BDU51133.1 hypothetical protein HLVA_17020 [Haliovirga abyssi]